MGAWTRKTHTQYNYSQHTNCEYWVVFFFVPEDHKLRLTEIKKKNDTSQSREMLRITKVGHTDKGEYMGDRNVIA